MHYTIINAHTYQVTITDKEREVVEKFIKDVEEGSFSKKFASWPEDLIMPYDYTRKQLLIITKNMLKGNRTRGNDALTLVMNVVRFCLSYYD